MGNCLAANDRGKLTPGIDGRLDLPSLAERYGNVVGAEDRRSADWRLAAAPSSPAAQRRRANAAAQALAHQTRIYEAFALGSSTATSLHEAHEYACQDRSCSASSGGARTAPTAAARATALGSTRPSARLRHANLAAGKPVADCCGRLAQKAAKTRTRKNAKNSNAAKTKTTSSNKSAAFNSRVICIGGDDGGGGECDYCCNRGSSAISSVGGFSGSSSGCGGCVGLALGGCGCTRLSTASRAEATVALARKLAAMDPQQQQQRQRQQQQRGGSQQRERRKGSYFLDYEDVDDDDYDEDSDGLSRETATSLTAVASSSAGSNQRQQQQQHPQSNSARSSSSNNNNNKQRQTMVIDHFGQMFHQPQYQQGLAYTQEQRKQHGLVGLLPPAVQDQDLQVRAVINFIDHCKDELGKYIYLRHLKDYNERLFYRTLTRNVEKLMPLVYTPTVGLGCQKFSEIYLRPRGLFISLNEFGIVDQVLANWRERDVRVIVVTDGERILGLGDLGANGMGISIGKLSLYTALAGIPPQNVLPITIDVGTNNQQLLEDPFYIGLRQQRLRGERYEALIDEFMKAVVERWGRSCLIQFEDFGNSTAFNLLKRYRDHYCTFNDDIQGTASVCLSGLLTAAKLIGKRLRDCSFLFYGAGEANLGTVNLLVMAMVEEGATRQEALKSIWLIDSKGLVVKSRTDLSSHKLAYAQDHPEVKELEAIVDTIKPSAIIGASAQGGAFNESICRKMAQFNERPIIFALSNPTSKAECTAEQAYSWTDARCVFASGSPFEPVQQAGKTYITGQGNNAYIFPGVGLAAIAAHVHTIPEETFLVAARALSAQVAPSDVAVGLVYPKLSRIREVTLEVAVRVLEHFYAERLATYRPEPTDKLNFLRGLQFDGAY